MAVGGDEGGATSADEGDGLEAVPTEFRALLGGQTGAQGALSHARVLAHSLDALIRSCRSTGRQSITPLAKRVLEYWEESPDSPIQIEADGVQIDGALALELDPEQGGWVLPAYMSGLRSFRPSESCSYEDLLRLAEELSTLRPNNESIEGFRDWLWADGAEGFAVELRRSFTEVMESAVADPMFLERALGIREDGGMLLGGIGSLIASAELDVAALQEEFGVSLCSYVGEVQGAEYELDEDERVELRERFEDNSAWTEAEMEVSFSVPAMRMATTADRLAQRLLTRITAGLNAKVLHQIADIMGSADDYSTEVVKFLERQQLGERIAEGADLSDQATREGVIDFLSKTSMVTGRGLAAGLLTRAEGDPMLAVRVRQCIRDVGVERFGSMTDTQSLSADGGSTLARLMWSTKAQPGKLAEFMAGLDPKVAVAAFHDMPDASFWECRPQIRELLLSRDRGVVKGMLDLLGTKEGSRGPRLLVEVLERNKGEGWNPLSLADICRKLAEQHIGRQQLVDWSKSTAISQALRLSSLRAIAPFPELVVEVTKRRMTGLFDPPEVKALIKALRTGEYEAVDLSRGPAVAKVQVPKP